MSMPIYLDNAASTACDPRVVEAMLPYFSERFGNSLGKHAYGEAARAGIERARGQVAVLLGAARGEIVFTGGASESNNLAIKGAARAFATAHPGESAHFITQSAEHKAVLAPMHGLEEKGFDVTYLPPDADGIVSGAQVGEAIRDDTLLVSIMSANNETGVINEIAAIGAACRARGVMFHTDATQYVGKVPVDVERDGIDLLSFTGHKMYGPKGCGALYVREACFERLRPIIEGGGHERGMRAGTLNTPGIVGLGMACELCRRDLDEEATRLRGMRRRLESALHEADIGARINGHPERRLPNIVNVCFESVRRRAVIEHITEIACSAGSALCGGIGDGKPGRRAASHVLASMGVPDDLAATALRLSLGRFTTVHEIERAAEHVIEVVRSIEQSVIALQ